MSEHMSPATSTPLSGRNTAPCPGACASWATTLARGPSQGISLPASGARRANSDRSWPGAASVTPLTSPGSSRAAVSTARGVAYRTASPSARLHSTWSQCGWVDHPAAGRRPREDSQPASRARSAGVTAGSMTRQPPPAPATTVVVVV
jgi:hypothetical protein